MKNLLFKGTLIGENLPDDIALEMAYRLGEDAILEDYITIKEAPLCNTNFSSFNLREFLLGLIVVRKLEDEKLKEYEKKYKLSEPDKYYEKAKEVSLKRYYCAVDETIEFLDKFVSYTNKVIKSGKPISLMYAKFYWDLVDRFCDFVYDDLHTYVDNNENDSINNFIKPLKEILDDSERHLLKDYAKWSLNTEEYTNFCNVLDFMMGDDTKSESAINYTFEINENGIIKNTVPALTGLGVFFENGINTNRCIPYEPIDKLIKGSSNTYAFTTGVCGKRDAYVSHIKENNADVIVDGVSLVSFLNKFYEVNPLVQLQGDYTGGVVAQISNTNRLSLVHLDDKYFGIEDTEHVEDYRASAMSYILTKYNNVWTREEMVEILDEAKKFLHLSNEVSLDD